MKLRDLTGAIAGNDLAMMRAGFRALVETDGRSIEAPSPGLRIVALNRLRVALAQDREIMPAETCAALGLPAGATFAAGAIQATREAPRIAQRLLAAA